MYREFASFITCCSSNDYDTNSDFEDVFMKPSELWVLCDELLWHNQTSALCNPQKQTPQVQAESRGLTRSLTIVFKLVVHELRRSMQGLRVEPLFYSMPNHLTTRQLQQGDTCFCQWIVLDKVGIGLEIADNNKDDNNGDQAIAEDGAAGDEVPIIDDDKDCDDEFDHLDVSGRVSCNH
ncbi:hypothetical protein MHU86_20190 [Fragilaria crotonensis]|nr:hypothetical protein MHU86_20190 [Fragilaria crotonensis]